MIPIPSVVSRARRLLTKSTERTEMKPEDEKEMGIGSGLLYILKFPWNYQSTHGNLAGEA